MRRNVIDRLALVCTLHADGPKTLRLLREAGCTTLDKLRDLEPKNLAKILGLTPASARRLLREVDLIRDRLDQPDLEREEVMYPPGEEAAGVKPAPPGLFVLEPTDEPRLPPRAELELRDRRLLDQVVDRWRREDERVREERAEWASDEEQEEEDEVSTEPVVEITAYPPRDLLRPGELSGLDESVCEALFRGGIASLEELATCPIDELVERSSLSFTRARTLQFLAGRRLASTSEPEPAVVPAARPSPFRGSDEGAGGPFA